MDVGWPERSPAPPPRERGRLGEDIAAAYLALGGARLLERNLRVGQKEIDLLVLEGDCLVFVEVKLRCSRSFGSALESISRLKLRRLRAALREELRRRAWPGCYRLDLITIDVEADGLCLERFKGI